MSSFLGMVNYMKRYSCSLSEISAPLRELTKDDVHYVWESAQQEAFEAVKEELTRTPILAYFGARKKHTVQTDASEQGLGGVLLQEEGPEDLRPVMYISRVWRGDTSSNRSQTLGEHIQEESDRLQSETRTSPTPSTQI